MKTLSKIIKVKWKTIECDTKNCWCRVIVPADDKEYGDYSIVSSGAIEKELAEHIVKIHNSFIEKNK